MDSWKPTKGDPAFVHMQYKYCLPSGLKVNVGISVKHNMTP
jgi:hypothetical protein